MTDHLACDQRGWVDAKLGRAFNNPDPVAGLRAAKDLAKLLEDRHPDAAASLREGLDDMFTVRRLGLSDRLCRTLSNTNAIESMISVAKTTTRNVKRWRDGKMIKRWVAAGMINAERGFRRVKGVKDMPTLPRSPVTPKLSHPNATMNERRSRSNRSGRHRTSTTIVTFSRFRFHRVLCSTILTRSEVNRIDRGRIGKTGVPSVTAGRDASQTAPSSDNKELAIMRHGTRRALLAAALLGMLGMAAAAPAAAQTVAQGGSAYAFGSNVMLTDADVIPPSAEAEVVAPPFGDDVDEALIEIPADPLAFSGTATAFAAVHETADLESRLVNEEVQHEVDGPYHALAEGVVENLRILVDAVDVGVDLVTADVVRGEAVAVCDGDTALYSASSEILGLQIGGEIVPLNDPLQQVIDGLNEILATSGLNALVDVERNVVTELEGGGIAVDALVVTVLDAAGDVPLATVRVGHAEVGPLTCRPAAPVDPISVSKDGPATVAPGDQFDYTITASNIDPEATCTDVTVVDTVTGPEGTEIVSVDPGEPEGSFEGLTATFNLGTLEAGETRALTVTVQVPPGSTGTVVDDVVMTATCDGDPFETTDRLEAPDIVPGPDEGLPRTGGPVPLALVGLAAVGGLAALGLRRRLG